MGTHVVWRTRKGLAPVFALIALLWLQNLHDRGRFWRWSACIFISHGGDSCRYVCLLRHQSSHKFTESTTHEKTRSVNVSKVPISMVIFPLDLQ